MWYILHPLTLSISTIYLEICPAWNTKYVHQGLGQTKTQKMMVFVETLANVGERAKAHSNSKKSCIFVCENLIIR